MKVKATNDIVVESSPKNGTITIRVFDPELKNLKVRHPDKLVFANESLALLCVRFTNYLKTREIQTFESSVETFKISGGGTDVNPMVKISVDRKTKTSRGNGSIAFIPEKAGKVLLKTLRDVAAKEDSQERDPA